MLATDPQMQDIDVDQWRNLQTLFTVSAKARPRIVVIHDGGTVCKLAHSAGAPIVGELDAVADPAADARRLHEANADVADFVMVLERSAVDAYYARLQDSWDAEEDLDAYVARSFALLDEFPEGIVTHPGPARAQLGLQFRVGADRTALLAAVERHVAPGSVVVIAITDGGSLWAGLVLGFDPLGKVATITTTPTDDSSDVALAAVISRVTADHGPVSLGVLVTREAADRVLARGVTVERLRDLIRAEELAVSCTSPELRRLLDADAPQP